MKLLVVLFLFSIKVEAQVKGDTLFVSDSIKIISFSKDSRRWQVDSTFIALPVAPLKIRRRFYYGTGKNRVRLTLYNNGTYIETK